MDTVKCPHCHHTSEIGSLIGPTTDDCPRCGKPVFYSPDVMAAVLDALKRVANVADTARCMLWNIDRAEALRFANDAKVVRDALAKANC